MFDHCSDKSVCMDAWVIPVNGWEQMLKQKPCSQEASCFYECDNILSIQKNPWLSFVWRCQSWTELWTLRCRSTSADVWWRRLQLWCSLNREINLLGSGIEIKLRSCLRSGAVSSVMIWKPGDHASDDVCATHKEFNPFSQIKALDCNTALWTERHCASDAFSFIEVQDYKL